MWTRKTVHTHTLIVTIFANLFTLLYNNCTMEGDMVKKLNIIYYSDK